MSWKIGFTFVLLCTSLGAAVLPACSWASRTGSGIINTNEPLSPEQKRSMTTLRTTKELPADLAGEPGMDAMTFSFLKKYEFKNVDTMHVHEGVDDHIFDDRTSVPDLEIVEIFDCPNLSALLKNLHDNYSDIQTIGLLYSGPIKLDSTLLLSRFPYLTKLSLSCSFEGGSAVERELPSLQILEIANSKIAEDCFAYSRLPNLQTLSVENSKIGPQFLQKLSAPKLTALKLVAATLEKDALACVAKFPNIQTLHFESMLMPVTELNQLAALKNVKAIVVKDAKAGDNKPLEPELRKLFGTANFASQ